MAFTSALLSEVESVSPALQKAGLAANLMAIQDGTANTTLASSKILVGDGNGAGQPVNISGDATLANTGALTVTQKINRTLTPAATGAAIPVTTSGCMSVVIADAAETNTLAIPAEVGQVLVLSAASLAGGGTRAVTVAAAINQAANTVITINTVTDCIVLIGVSIGGSLRWRVLMNDGCTLS